MFLTYIKENFKFKIGIGERTVENKTIISKFQMIKDVCLNNVNYNILCTLNGYIAHTEFKPYTPKDFNLQRRL